MIRADRRIWGGYAGAGAAVALATIVAALMAPRLAPANLVMMYLLAVLVAATRFGRGPSMLASVLSVTAFNFFFVPPRFTLAVTDTQYLVTLAVMLLVAFVISNLATRLRDQVARAHDRGRRTAALYAMSRDLGPAPDVPAILNVATRHLSDVFTADVGFLLATAEGELVPQPPSFEIAPEDRETARWAFDHRQPAGLGTTKHAGAAALYLPLTASRGVLGVLVVRPAAGAVGAAAGQLQQLEAFASQAAVALERARLTDQARDAEIRMQTERMRNALLSSVSHDLRTPLATITGAATSLLREEAGMAPPVRRELLGSIRDEAERLTRLVHNLLEMTRLESGTIVLTREWHAVEEVVGAAVRRCARTLEPRRLDLRVPADLPLVEMDDVLIEQVLVNLLDNAAKHGRPAAPVTVAVTADPDRLTVEVADSGPGIPAGDEERVFDKFFRSGAAPRGAGLGLTIARGIIEAHGGRIWAHNRPEGGAAFFFWLPRTRTPPPVPTDSPAPGGA
jgi:two-component system sensor histidine kinase KdpD